MNYFAHGRQFCGDPYFLAGTAIPDWLNVVDRRVRIRARHARPFVDDAEASLASLAQGIVRHHDDDDWFHRTAAFGQLSLELCRRTVAVLPGEPGFRPSFLGHILVEILLDAALIAENPQRLDDYYAAVDQIDGNLVEQAVNRMSPAVQTDQLQLFVGRFASERFLFDYADDAKLLFRLNQVMRRVGLAELPPDFLDLLPAARVMVAERKVELLTMGSHGVVKSS